MKKLMKKNFHMEQMILPILTLFCLTGFIGSLIFPKKVLDTYKINVTEEEGDTEYVIPLSGETPIFYEMNTAGQPMKGIQVGISKEGASQEGVFLRYQVYEHSTEKNQRLGSLLSDNLYEIASGDEVQYVYLPYAQSELCKGDIIIRFTIESQEITETEREFKTPPALLANHTLIDNTLTRIGDEDLDGNIKTMYIYSHDTYPLLYDFRLMTFVFLAASMAVSYPKLNKKGGKKDEK